MWKKTILILVSLISTGLYAQNPVITAKDFAALLKSDKNLVVLDVNATDVYGSQHIQGAINLPHKELYKPGVIEGQIKPSGELSAIFGKKGISATSKIVVCDDGTNRYTSRVWWILKSVGAADVSILHFNMDQFAAAKIPLTAAPATRKATTFTVSEKPEMVALMSELQNPAAGLLLLDAREKDEFEGKDAAKRSKGHIPAAVWLNYKEVLTPSGAFKSKDEIIAIAGKYGVTPDKPVIVYCQTGIKASVLYVALREIAGFSMVKNYAGAFAEWASVPENKIVQ